jgi:hypothetical protein
MFGFLAQENNAALVFEHLLLYINRFLLYNKGMKKKVFANRLVEFSECRILLIDYLNRFNGL